MWVAGSGCMAVCMKTDNVLNSSCRNKFFAFGDVADGRFPCMCVCLVLFERVTVYFEADIHGFHYISDMHAFLEFSFREIYALVGRKQDNDRLGVIFLVF